MCIENGVILAELLADDKVRSYEDVEKAFAVCGVVRRPRGEFIVQSSRYMGECYEHRMAGVNTFADVESELLRRNAIIHDVDVPQMYEDARADLVARVEWNSSRKMEMHFSGSGVGLNYCSVSYREC